MKLKTKLITTIISSCLVLCIGVFGIFAVKNLNMSVGGNISFTADGITATISQGYLYNSAGTKYADSDVFVTGGTSEDMQPITITNDKKESEYTSLIATWANLDLKFNSAGDDIVLKFTINNTMSTATLPVAVTASEGVDKNNNITLTVAPTTTDPIAISGSREYSITFHISDKSVNASLTGFNIEFVLGNVPVTFDMQQTDTTHGTATYEVNEQTRTVTLSTTLKTNSAFLGWAKNSEENIVAGTLTTSVPYETSTYYPVYSSIDNLPLDITTSGRNASVKIKSSRYRETAPIYVPGVVNISGTNYIINEIPSEAFVYDLSDSKFAYASEIHLPNTIETIGSYAFFGCKITSLRIPSSVTSIGELAVAKCPLTELIVEDGNTVYDSRNNCNAVIETASNKMIIGCATTVLPNTVTTLGQNSIAYTPNLVTFTIPASITKIEDYAFSSPNGMILESVIIENPTPISVTSPFHFPSATVIYVPDSSLSAYQSATGWKNYTIKGVSEYVA